MHIIIVGAGGVGSNIAASLAQEHDVVVIDTDPDVVDELTYSLDVLALCGDGTSLPTLQHADIDSADLLIACTDDDEVNLVTCSTARVLSEAFTIARVRKVDYLETWNFAADAFGVDSMVSTDLRTAEDVADVIGLPAAIDVDPFAGGLVQMAEFQVPPGSPVTNQTVAEADEWDSLTVAAIVRNGDLTVPSGGTVIEADDKVVVIGRPESVTAFAGLLSPDRTDETSDVVVVGGSSIGYQTAKLLEERGRKPRLIEQDESRARELAEDLPDTVVMQHDATDAEFLTAEHVDEADIVVAALDSDEKNLLISLLANSLGVNRTIAIVESGAYTTLFERVAVDVAINPREVTAEEIIRHTEKGDIQNLSLIENRKAEILEFEVDGDSVLANRSIEDAAKDLPADLVIGAITRDNEFIVPRGSTIVEPGDHVVLFVASEFIDEVTAAI